MKLILICLLTFVISSALPAQNTKNKLPPGYIEQLKKSLPPGTELPPEYIQMLEKAMSQYGEYAKEQNEAGETAESLYIPQPLISLPEVQEMSLPTETEATFDYSPFGSGRNEAQRKAALLAVEAELNSKPLLLPLPESCPTKDYMLSMAAERFKIAKQKFTADDLTEYSTFVNWVPRFDGSALNKGLAAKYSMAVALSTNNNPFPNFNIALACTSFSLDPESSVQANNLASAIISGGELITEKNPTREALAIYRRDAESGFLYAINHSLNNGQWGEATLTPAINLGNLCIDLGKLEEARSLFMVARKIKPESWDAALGLAAYFMALNQKDKALAILEDENLDYPAKQLIPIKKKKELEKSEPFANLPPDSPEEKFQQGIKTMAEQPIATSADFIAQLDQSERNKMRYFIENLAVKGSFKAPSIKKLTQYASLKAISSPQGKSALEDFSQMLGIYQMGSIASSVNQQLDWLSKYGLKIDPGVDLDDVMKHPEKYADKDLDENVKISGMEEFMANMENLKKDAMKAQTDLAAGRIQSTMQIASGIDNIHGILLINPEDFADPMNVIMQKINYTVFQRKSRLYQGFLRSSTNKTYKQVMEVVEQSNRKIREAADRQNAELNKLYEEKRIAEEKMMRGEPTDFNEAEWALRLHAVHVKYFNIYNNIEETGFGSATNVASVAYEQKIKPMVEAYYYDVFRHVAMISDPEVRNQKNTELNNVIRAALNKSLTTVLIAHGAFSYSDEWDCDCDEEALLAAREREKAEEDAEENARIERNKVAKAVFDSGEIPEASPLFKKLDAYVDEYNFGLIKVRSSCARTVVETNTEWLTKAFNLPASFNYKSTESEFTGAITRTGGIKVGYDRDIGPNAKATMNLNLSLAVSSDGNGVVKDYSVTAGATAGVKVGDYALTTGISGNVQGNQNGIKDYSITENVNVTAKYGQTTVSGGASVTGGSKGFDSDFSGKISQDFKNGVGTDANATFEASTKRGCSLSGKVDQTVNPAGVQVQKADVDKVKKESGLKLNTDFYKKDLWSGKFDFNTLKGSFTK